MSKEIICPHCGQSTQNPNKCDKCDKTIGKGSNVDKEALDYARNLKNKQLKTHQIIEK